MKKIYVMMASAMLFVFSASVLAQSGNYQRASEKRKKNPYSTNYKMYDVTTSGTFFVEYNPFTWHESAGGITTNTNYQGLSVGLDYFFPVFGDLGIAAGVKGQYFFRNKEENGADNKFQMVSGTVPVNLAYSMPLAAGLQLVPYVGVYGRYVFTAKNQVETSNSRIDYNYFNENHFPETMKHFQAGWQVGANLRISEMVTVGGGYWMDLTEILSHTTLRGFDVRIGANF